MLCDLARACSLRLVNQRLLAGQSQVEELQRSLQEQGLKADDVSNTTELSRYSQIPQAPCRPASPPHPQCFWLPCGVMDITSLREALVHLRTITLLPDLIDVMDVATAKFNFNVQCICSGPAESPCLFSPLKSVSYRAHYLLNFYILTWFVSLPSLLHLLLLFFFF